MSSLFLSWLVAPAGLLLVTVGLSLLVERLIDLRIPWTLRPALGLAVAMVLAQFGTAFDSTAPLTIPATLLLAALGLLFAYGFVDSRPTRAALVIAAVVFAVYAAPVVASGSATWTGYIKLDDTATWMALADHVFHSGRGVDGVPHSTYGLVLHDYLDGNYPIGSFVPMAVMSFVSGQDVAWTVQPSMAFGGSVLALGIFELIRDTVRTAWITATIAIASALSAILIGYYLWGGVKEVITAAMLPLAPALVGYGASRGWPRSISILLAVAVAAAVVALGPGGLIWVVPMLLGGLFVLVRDRGVGEALRMTGLMAGGALILVLPVLFNQVGALFNPSQGPLAAGGEIGNLTGPLNLLHVAGVWPALDFRDDPHLKPVVLAISGFCVVLAAGALVVCARLRGGAGLGFAGYLGGGVVGTAVIIHLGSAWVDGKAMATISPAILAGALVAIAMAYERTDFRLESAVLGGLVVFGVAWGAFLAYRGVWLAPRGPYSELASAAERFAGEGPTLVNEISIFGPRHFLRDLDAEGTTERRYRGILLTGGRESTPGTYHDLDEIAPDQLEPYNLIVDRRGPIASRPPADFELAFAGTYYDVWRRNETRAPGRLIQHLPLGNELDPGGVPDCAELGRMAAATGAGRLVAARASGPVTVHIGEGDLPAGWGAPTTDTVRPTGAGTATAPFSVPREGQYRLWLSGGVFGRARISVDGDQVGGERGVIENIGAYDPLGTVTLSPGTHRLELAYSQPLLLPGSAVTPFSVGPVILDPGSGDDLGTVTVPAAQYRRLCGTRWDWIESYS